MGNVETRLDVFLERIRLSVSEISKRTLHAYLRYARMMPHVCVRILCIERGIARGKEKRDFFGCLIRDDISESD